jgi:hypothetical protein
MNKMSRDSNPTGHHHQQQSRQQNLAIPEKMTR